MKPQERQWGRISPRRTRDSITGAPMNSTRIHRLFRFLQSPVFEDEERTLRASLLNVTLWLALLVVILLLIGNLLSGFAYAAVLPVQLALLPICAGLLWLNRRGYVAQAAYLLLLATILSISVVLAKLGSVSMVVSGVYLVALMLVGLILPARAAISAAAITAVAVLSILWAEEFGLLPPPSAVDPITRSINWISMIMVVAGVMLLTRRQSQRLLDRYRSELAERRRIEDALRYSQAHLLGLLSALPDFIFISDRNGVYHDIFTSEIALLPLPARQMIGKSVFDLFPPEQAQAFIDVLCQACDAPEGAAPIEYEYAIAAGPDPEAPGGRYWYQARIVAYAAPEGQRVLWVARDITAARRQARALEQLTAELEQRVQERTARLEEVNHELEAFAYTISHDLRAPLRALNGYARLLDEDYGPGLPEDARQMLDMLRKGAAQMGSQIDDLLRLADRPLQRQPVEMTRLAEAAVYTARAGCDPERNVRFRLDELPPANADQALVERVLVNLLDNAIKYTRPCPLADIHIGARPAEGGAIYFVADNGIGFEMSAADRIFAPFERLHADQDFTGSGLGLASARRIIERHGGRIWADSRPGAGATFFFTLPE